MIEPIPPMLARLARDLPVGDFLYEPKWDGFRALVFRDGEEIDIRSRHGRPLARYFPELVDAFRQLDPPRFALDGEIVLARGEGLDFAALMARLHPTASRVERLAVETPASFVAFDLLGVGDRVFVETPFVERRALLEDVLANVSPPLALTPITAHVDVAAGWLERFEGVVAKARDLRYLPGKRAMVKIKVERTADCVVAGLRVQGEEPVVSSLLLGLYDDGELRHVGVVTSFTEARRRDLLGELEPLVAPLEGHPWEHGFGLGPSPLGRLLGSAGRWDPREMERDWVPLRPVRVCEVAFDQLDAGRFRHPARFRRWRPDRTPESCGFDQLPGSAGTELVHALGAA